ncbi:MAG: C40 family peptidase, partial [Saccharofermentans sp.]|nr:C40 family peptidase [Saccharofermentans sp.]
NGIAVGLSDTKSACTLMCDTFGFRPSISDETTYNTDNPIQIVTSGRNLENIWIRATDDNYYGSYGYQLYYRVRSAKYGWMAWTTLARSGTNEIGDTISAVQIVLLPKGQTPSNTLNGVTSQTTESYVVMQSSQLITDGNPFAQWCLDQFPADPNANSEGYYRVSYSWPYVYGGTSRSGCDCSGFVVYVMREYFHKNVYHGMHTLSFNRGRNISYSEMRPGDWLCDWSYQHGWVYFYVGRDNYGHEIVLNGNAVRPVLEYWDIEAWASEDKHDIRRP